jgi:hypothetical protein
MPLRAAAIEVDITPPVLPIEKPGWILKILADRVEDRIFCKIAVIESADGTRVGFISLDVLSIRWPEADRLRTIAAAMGIPKVNLMVAATHVHTGPAISSPGLARRDERYVDFLVDRVGEGLQRAVESLQPARVAVGSALEGRVSYIRRCIMKDGTLRTHPPPTAEIRCPESVIDPEIGLVALEDLGGRTLGVIVNFALHPVHGGGGTAPSAGWPGQMAIAIQRATVSGCVTCFLNGALGDVHHQPTIVPDAVDTREHVGQTVAETVTKALPGLSRSSELSLAAAAETLRIPLRHIEGPYGVNMKGMQRFAPDEVYEQLIARLRAKKARRDHVLAEVQAIRLGEQTALVSLPCEPFSAIGLAIKRQSPFANTYVVGCANGMIGYVPTREAFERGGYETTLSMGSKLDPSAGELLIDAALRVLRSLACCS